MYLVKASQAANFPIVHDGPNVAWSAGQVSMVDDNMYARYLQHTGVFTVVAGPDMGAIVQALLDEQATDSPGAKNGSTVTADENQPVVHSTVLTCTATPVTITDDAGVAQYGGVKVYDFPSGLICVLGAVVSGELTAGVTGTIIDNWDGDVSLGTETATTGATLTGTEADIMQSVAVSAGAADKIGVVDAVSAAAALTESGARWIDGTTTAADVFLNFLIDDDATHTAGTAAFTGKVTLTWINLGDNA